MQTAPRQAGRRIGIVGVPPLEIIRRLHAEKATILDLDEPQLRIPLDVTESCIPKVYCAVLRTVVLNALHLDLDGIYIDVGPGKCDSALHVSTILDDMLDIPVVRTRNCDQQDFGVFICRTRMDMVEKMRRITAGVRLPTAVDRTLPACRPTAGFWGVPPRDFSLLADFPETTHIYGWTRCMENKTPAHESLERHINPDIPTVFFAQSFCAKSALARHLARLHPCALYLDCDATATASVKAKIEAFLELSGVTAHAAR